MLWRVSLQILIEYFGKLFAARYTSVFKGYYVDNGAYHGFALRREYILVKNKNGATAAQRELRYHALSQPQRMEIADVDVCDHRIHSLLVHTAERQACLPAKLVARVLEIVQIDGIVDNALGVDFIVSYSDGHFKNIVDRSRLHMIVLWKTNRRPDPHWGLGRR